jgi:hypothetical protein
MEGGWIPHRQRADGTGSIERLMHSSTVDYWPTDISPDDRHLLITHQTKEFEMDILTMEVEGEETPRPFMATEHNETAARFSPNGRWVAYTSDEDGRFGVYVTGFPGAEGKWRVSRQGATEPVWSRDGTELFFLEGRRLMVAAVTTEGTFLAAPPEFLFEIPYQELKPNMHWAGYDVFPGGKEFVTLQVENTTTSARVITNWFDVLKRTTERASRR